MGMTEPEALEIARETAIEQIRVSVAALADPMDGCADHMKAATDIQSRHQIIEAGRLLATLREPG